MLRERMGTMGWNQTRLSEQLAVSSSVISRWLSGERTPTVEMACRIEDLLGIPVRLWRPDAPKKSA
jgi:transcriptional regulator with XRE-family HTH domain